MRESVVSRSKDGSCTGKRACWDARLDDVKGPSCAGQDACRNSEFSLVTESCNEVSSCQSSKVSLIEKSCNSNQDRPTYQACRNTLANSIVEGYKNCEGINEAYGCEAEWVGK